MKKKDLFSKTVIDEKNLNYEHPYYVPIEDGDEETIKYYRSNDVPVTHITLPGRMPHYYAIIDAATQEEADMMKRLYNTWEKKSFRDKDAQSKFETSFDYLWDKGFDKPADEATPEEIVVEGIVFDALHKELKKLAAKKKRVCKMVANKESQRAVADEMEMPRSTLKDLKNKVLSDLEEDMKDYK